MLDVLTIQNVAKNYGNEQALKGISLSIEPGHIVGLLGPNGSGKTTLIKIIAGLIQDYTGDVRVMGQSIGRASKAMVSYLPDREFLPNWLRVRGAVSMFRDFYADFDPNIAQDMLRQMKVDENKQIKALSKGMREKLNLALVLARRAHLYLLDEPIAGVDPAARDYILSTILNGYAKEGAILISTHIISDIEPVLHDCVMLREGAIAVSGNVDSIRAQHGQSLDALFREVFRC